MRTLVVKILLKNGDKKIGNYRPVSLACTEYETFAKIITEKLKPTISQVKGID